MHPPAQQIDRSGAGGALLAPLVEELRPMPDVVAAFLRLSALPHCVFFDSALVHPTLGRYSFLAADPFDRVEAPADGSGALARLRQHCSTFRAARVEGLPPFQGGAAGLFGYELARQLERLPRTRFDEFAVPSLAVGLYDVVVAFDHIDRRAWIVSHGLPELEPAARARRAAERLDWMRRTLEEPPRAAMPLSASNDWLPADQLAPRFAVAGVPELISNYSPENYFAAAARAIEYIHAGDVFQVNLAQRLLHPAREDPVDLYLRLRQCNPATFAGYLDLGSCQIASASPERFLRVANGLVETRPIKGTRQRTAQAEADLFAGEELRASEKDRAENVMIVDLLRNDLSRVCLPETVRVTELCRLESYAFVQHLVSAVEGRLAPHRTALDLLEAAFPGGSITGAPKVRAMEVIAELEPTARGAYCGSLGYLGFDGSMDSNILIRTITAARGWWQAPVGGGIVAQSVPEQEYAETWHKAKGLIRAMRGGG